MNQTERDVVQRLQDQERQRLLQNPPRPKPESGRPMIHWTDLAEAVPGSRIATEWNFYRKQIGQLLADGNEGKWVLIKGEEIIGIWDTVQEADQMRAQQLLKEDVLIHQVLAWEPVLRGPTSFWLCHG